MTAPRGTAGRLWWLACTLPWLLLSLWAHAPHQHGDTACGGAAPALCGTHAAADAAADVHDCLLCLWQSSTAAILGAVLPVFLLAAAALPGTTVTRCLLSGTIARPASRGPPASLFPRFA